jgi:hypothetical protein
VRLEITVPVRAPHTFRSPADWLGISGAVCHRRLAFLNLMACFCHPLPLLPCFLLSDGKIFTGRAICKLTYLYPMANISPIVPSLPCVSSLDGKNFVVRAIANLLIFIRWQTFRRLCHRCLRFFI